ncbi:hypothetical protein F5B20DRAFT_572782 [Whalleya microplaca]|nr:hypothetical protein F5B20DRAFT_572782 [Whalleya microplaca]
MATSSYDHGDRQVVAAAAAPIPTPEGRTFEDHLPYHHHPPSPSTTPRPGRKRAHTIDIEEANQPRIQDLRLYTPTTSKTLVGDGPRELICLCTKAPKVPRPRNAFILYRQHYQGQVAAQHPGLANPEISKLIGEQWRKQPDDVKNSWKRLAEEEKVRHSRQYPDYRYQPRRGGKNASGRPLSTAPGGEDPGRCPKCGGRYIATPRTPSTPLSAVTTVVAKSPNMPPYINPNPRVVETDHMRRNSTSSMVSVDGNGRRYTQPQLGDIDEHYPMMSPIGGPPPQDMAKRRRFNGPNVFVPGSPPPTGYYPIDPRYQPRPSVGGPPMSAPGYGPGSSLPRPGIQYRQPNHSGHPHQAVHMQPPPRPSSSYQSVPTPNRPTAGFDESLRLPPLQTQIPNSPSTNSDARPMSGVQPTHSTSAGIVNGSSGTPRQQPPPPPPQQQQHQQMPPRWSFLLKLDVLRSISPPLKPPGPGGPVFETRGPIIAIEGGAPSILREVAVVVEKALAVSGEYAVKIWSEDTMNNNNNNTNNSSTQQANAGAGETNGKTSTSNGSTTNETHKPSETTEPLPQKKTTGFLSPLATYVARMLKWHKTSDDLIRYVTTHPAAAAGSSTDGDDGAKAETSPKLPVAVIADGYSLTVSDRYAGSLHVADAYRADDHWQWVATLWRGIVGADLTIYVKRAASEAEIQGNNCVEFATGAGGNSSSNNTLVLRVVDGRGIDERLERRLGFEIIEWVRSGSFRAGFAGGRR